MPLRPEPDVSHAAWFATSKAPWTQLCTVGPSGFEKYGRLFHPLDEGADEHDPDELVNLEGHLDDSHLERLLTLLARHTNTPDDCFFGLWDGFGDLYGSPSVGFFHTGVGKRPDVPPAFPTEVGSGVLEPEPSSDCSRRRPGSRLPLGPGQSWMELPQQRGAPSIVVASTPSAQRRKASRLRPLSSDGSSG
jgi:hypothetical protein